MCHEIVLWICVLDQGNGKMSNLVMVMWFLWRPLWPASHHLKGNENFQRKMESGTQVPLGLVGWGGDSWTSCLRTFSGFLLLLRMDCRYSCLGVSARVCKTSHWGCSVPLHAPVGVDSNSTIKVGEDSDNVRRHLATSFCQSACSDAHG